MTERLLESVNMVKELLQSNKQLRGIIDQKSQDAERSQNEVTVLQLENQDMKDKIDVLTRLVHPPSTEDVSSLDVHDLFSEESTALPTGSEQLAREVLGLRRANRTLEDRVHQLELHNSQISKGLETMGNIEPAKPSFRDSGGYSFDSGTGTTPTQQDWRRRPPTMGRKNAAAKRGGLRSGSAALERPKKSNSFYAPEVQVTKNVWAPTTIYAIGGAEMPAIRQKMSETAQAAEDPSKMAAISKLSEILNSRMKLYKKNN